MAEYFDVLDKNGASLGMVKKKIEVHRDGDWHKAILGWIVNHEGKVLMQKRSELEETHPGTLDISFAGHVSSGESSIDTVIREAYEELGLKITENEAEYLFTTSRALIHNNGSFLDNEIFDLYLILKDLDISTLKLGDEVDGVELLDFRELEQKVKENDPKVGVHPESYDKMFVLLHSRFDKNI
jgi:isopentenyldiphosphate isomerase